MNLTSDLDSQVAALRALKPGWDSYGGSVISEAAIAAVVKVLDSAATLVPCSDGGVQIDWPTAEMTFRPDGSQEFDEPVERGTVREAHRG